MKVTIKADGWLSQKGFNELKTRKFRELHEGVKRGLEKGGKIVVEQVRSEVSQALNIKRKAALKSFKARVYAHKTDRLPAIEIGSRVSVFGAHQAGALITPSKHKFLFIPAPGIKFKGKLRPGKQGLEAALSSQGYKSFLLPNRQGKGYSVFRYKKQVERAKFIGVLTPQIQLKARYSVPSIVLKNLGVLTGAISKEFM